MVETTKQRMSISILNQKRILEMIDAGNSYKEITKTTGVKSSAICSIKRRREKIEGYIHSDENGDFSSRKRLKPASHPNVDRTLYLWFLQQRSAHVPVSNQVLREQGKVFHEKLCSDESCSFVASDGWVLGFKKRRGLRNLKITGEKLSANDDAVGPFKLKLFEQINEMGLSLDQIYNADETALYWRMLPSKTVVHKLEKSAPGRKISKERITVTGCCNVTGTHKLPLQIIGKSKNPRHFKNKRMPSLAFYAASRNAWQTKVLFKEYFEKVFIPGVRQFAGQNNLEPKAILILDNASSHNDEESLISDDGLIKVVFLPPNVTSIIQPMDQNCLLPLKTRYRNALLKKLLIKESVNLINDLKSFELFDAILLIANCWDELPNDVIFRSWQKILSGLDMFDTVQNFSHDETSQIQYSDINSMLSLINNMANEEGFSRNISLNDLQDWLSTVDKHSTSIEFTVDELVQYVNGTYEESQLVDEEQEESDSIDVENVWSNEITENDLPMNDIKRMQTAIFSLENLINFYENNIEAKLYLRHLKSELEMKILGAP